MVIQLTKQRRGLEVLPIVSTSSRASLYMVCLGNRLSDLDSVGSGADDKTSLSERGDGWGFVNRLSISSNQGAVLSRRPVAERRHLGRVLCGLTCPLRYAPSESVAAGATQRLDCGHRRISDKSPPIPALRIRSFQNSAPLPEIYSEKTLLH